MTELTARIIRLFALVYLEWRHFREFAISGNSQKYAVITFDICAR